MIHSKYTRNTFQSFSTSRLESSFSIFVVRDGWAQRALDLSFSEDRDYLGRVDAEMGIWPKENHTVGTRPKIYPVFVRVPWISCEYLDTCIN